MDADWHAPQPTAGVLRSLPGRRGAAPAAPRRRRARPR
jgi:hypothetical protein